jgi:mannose-1-phosphate guanylyltransferase
MLEHYYAVIMAGGGGTRLWPLSRQSRPKQMLALFDDRTLFQTAVLRLKDLFPPERIFVVTVKEQAAELQAQCPELPPANFLPEPEPRGTAGVVGIGAVAVKNVDPQAVMAVLSADHFIANEALFRQLLITAYDVAQDGYLVTLGVEPTFPATGFGYIQKGKKLAADYGQEIFYIKRFKEKPDEVQARAMLASGDFAWNSGMFFWRVDRIMAELRLQMPVLAAGLDEIDHVWGTSQLDTTLPRVWSTLKTETIDYGVMEKAEEVVVISAVGLRWNDVGSWDSLFDVLESDGQGNIIMGGEHIGLNTHNSLIYVNQERRLIVTIGVDDLVVVDTGDVLLVCRKDQAQQVRQVVNQLRQTRKNFI